MAKIRNTRLLVVDDEPIKREVMVERLTEMGCVVHAYDNAVEAEKAFSDEVYDVVLTDIRMPGVDGISFLRNIKEKKTDQAVIVMTAFGTVETAIEAMKLGAYDYLQRPFSTEELILKLDRLMNFKGVLEENLKLRKQLGHNRSETKLIGKSPAMKEILSQIHVLAAVDSNVLIRGDSGTGKECVARLIHESSTRSGGRFVAVSCASLPSELIEAELFGYEEGAFTGASKDRVGRFELADGGTIFLDDVDDIPLDLQVKLLRIIQERTFERIGGEITRNVNVRLIAATKKDLASLVREGKFREDLYFRLNIIPLYIPPLRHRKQDIPTLCEHFMNVYAVRLNRLDVKMGPDVMDKLMAYSWPGNVRELQNHIERMLVLSKDGQITTDLLPPDLVEPDAGLVTICTDYIDTVNLPEVLSSVEDRLVQWALFKSNGNLAKAASCLNIPRSSLQYKVSKLGHLGTDENSSG
ncbi:MAG: sigma-54-dependent transcriptional regulator [Planctomycetota bacterium]|jgi:DNA-binding NtrC family response regulator